MGSGGVTGTFHELVIGGVLISPFVTYAVAALVLVLLIRPVLARAGFEDAFAAPPMVLLALYIVILAILILVF